MNNEAIIKKIKDDFIHQFNASGSIDSIKEYGLETLIQALKTLGMSEEEIDINLATIKNELNKLMDKLVAEAADKIHSCKKCLKESITGVCTKYKKVYYCSKECQVKHWQIHKKA